jgi:2-oxoisovalerate dehydrogenase E2 component (dihydrolipoyl transacylase)
LLPFMIRALAQTLPRFPHLNARYDDEAGILQQFAAFHAGIATQTPKGLLVTVLRDAQTKSLWELAAEIARLSDLARSGRATAHELSGSTLTLSSLGALGGFATTPVINSPEVAIVGINKLIERPVVAGGSIAIARMMNLSASFDHRIVDGWDAANFIQQVRAQLEEPALLLVD